MEKKWLMALSATLLFATSFAQVSLHVYAGTITTTNQLSEKVTGAPTYSSRAGFVIGGSISKRLFKSIGSETGLSYNLRRYGYRSSPVPDYLHNFEYRIGYLMLNQLFLVKVKSKNGWSFSTGTGFFAGLPFHGRYMINGPVINSNTFQGGRLDFGNNSTDNFKQFDAGANILLRLQYHKILLNVLYNHSLIDHIPAGHNMGYKEKFRGFSITAGYEF